MALVVYDRVQETTATTGTGSITLGGAVDGFQSFAIVGNGNTTYYCIVNGLQWEVGLGTYSTSGPTLARTTVYSNSSGTLSPITLVGASNVFLTYPSERSVNLDASGNVTALGTVTSGAWNGSTIPVAYGGTGVTASSGANSVMLRDANQNVSINRLNQSNTSTAAAGGITALTAASSYSQTLTGTGNQTYTMPDATTLATGVAFVFNNNATGTLTLQDYASGSIGIVTSGGAVELICVSAATTGGTWDYHGFLPENVTWGTNALALGGTVITGGTWNGGTIQSGYGGTGLTTFTAANNALYSTSSSALAAGTLPIAAGGTAKTSFTANQVLYGSLSQSANFIYNGTVLQVAVPANNTAFAVTDQSSSDFLINPGIVGGICRVGPSAGGMALYSNNAEAARITSAGSVGIGTASPGYKLTVDGGITAINNQQIGINGTGVAAGVFVFRNSAGVIKCGIGSYYNIADEGALEFINGSTTNMILRSSGYLGIGTTNPSVKLEVNQAATSFPGFKITGNNSPGMQIVETSGVTAHFANDSAGVYFGATTSNPLILRTANTERMQITAAGSIAMNPNQATSGAILDIYGGGSGSLGALRMGDGTLSGGHTNYWDIGRDNSYTGDFTFYLNSVEKMRITTAGALAFGSAGNYGSSGQLLQSNGNASPSWISQSSITAGSASNVAGLVANTFSTYTNIASTTAKGGFYGMLCGTGSNYPALMFDGSGGGIYKENTGFWALYYSYGSSCVGIGSSATTGGYALQVNGSQYTTGTVVAASSVTSPIFYDSNTAYYGDFAGTSVVNQFYANGMFGAINDMPRYTAGAVSGMGPATDWDNRPYVGYSGYGISWHTGVSISGYPSYGGVRLYSASYPTLAGSTLRLEASTGVYTYGVFTNDSQITAPIYYDTDTAYYADFNSTSDSAIRVRGGALHGPNVTWGVNLLVGGDGRQNYTNTGTPSVCATNGNLHIDAGSGYETYLNYYDGDVLSVGRGTSSGFAMKVFGASLYTEIYGSTRSPIFYAYPNTAYYVIPDGNTQLRNLFVDNYMNLSTSTAGNSQGYAGSWTSTQNANGNFIPFSFASTYGNHSWGIVARFRIDGAAGGDRPSIQFSSGYTDNRWNIGFAGYDDSFRIVQNMGYRNDGATTDNWGSPRVLIDTSGNVFNYVSTYSPIFYDLDNTGYYLNLNGTSNFGTIITGTAQFQSNMNTASGSSPPLQAYSTAGLGAIMSFHRGGAYAVNLGLDSDNVFRLGGWSAPANVFQINPIDGATAFSFANFIRRMNFRARELSFQNNETDDNFFFNFSDQDGNYGYNKSLIFRGLGSGGGSGHDLVSVSISATTTYVNNLSKSSGSFRIEHPLESLSETHELVHSFIEGPQIDLIYRGVVSLVNGTASVNIDLNSSMTEGTFEALCREVQCFTTNETDWTPVRGKVIGNILTIEAQDATSTASISWMVLGERKDKHIMNTNMTDEYGKLIVEPLKTERYWNYN